MSSICVSFHNKQKGKNKKKDKKESLNLLRRMLIYYFSYWIKTYPMHFDLDKRLKEACEKMQNLIESSGDTETKNLVDQSQM